MIKLTSVNKINKHEQNTLNRPPQPLRPIIPNNPLKTQLQEKQKQPQTDVKEYSFTPYEFLNIFVENDIPIARETINYVMNLKAIKYHK